jgi:hypothetical protein
MPSLEILIHELRDSLSQLPHSVEREIGLRAARHALSLISRDIISASDAYYRAKRNYELAARNTHRRAS